MSFDSYFAAVRQACLPAVWSDGVALARSGAVLREREKPDELTLRVRAAGHAVDLVVTLYVQDDEWSCNCRSPADPCAHVAAATIAVKQNELVGAAPPPQLAHVAYAFTLREQRLILRRAVRSPEGNETPLVGLLSSLLAQRKLPPNLAPSQNDLKVDRMIETRAELRVPLHELAPMFEALSGAERVTLDGAPVKLSGETLQPSASVQDTPAGFAVVVSAPPGLEVVARGVGRLEGVLRPLGTLELAGDRYEKLPLTRHYGAKDAADLAQRVVPELESTMAEVTIRSRKLPRRTRDALPRLEFEVTHEDGLLFVLPRIVYGEPAVARLEGDQLIALGREAPKRRPHEEAQLVHALRAELNLVPSRRVDFRGAEAARFLGALRTFQSRRDAAVPELAAGAELVPQVAVGAGGTLEVTFAGAGGSADAATVLSAWQAGFELVPLLDGGFAPRAP